MIVHVSANIAKMLTELAAASERTSEDMVEDALVGYFEEVAARRRTLDTFAATVHSSRFDFVGTVRRADILGMLNGERVRLERDRDEPDTFESDKDLANWCRAWTRRPRCGGVRDLCASLGQPS